MFDMDKERCIRFTPGKWLRHAYFGPAIAVVGFLLFWRLVYWPWGDDGIDLSAWVQAVGSIGAILAAIHIATEQRRADAMVREGKQAVVLIVTAEIANEAVARLRSMNYALMKHFRPITDGTSSDVLTVLEQFDRGAMRIESIDLIALPNPSVVEAVIKLRAVFEYARHIAVAGRSPALAVQGNEEYGPLIWLVREAESCVSAIRKGG